MSSSFIEIKGRVSEKKLAELKEIVALQNQEILRLQNEQKSLIEAIDESEVRNSQTETILKKRIAKLQSEISSYSSKKSILRSHSMLAHSKLMSEQQAIHQDNIMRLRTQYESKIAKASLKSNAQSEDTTKIINKIDETCIQISKVLNEKIGKNEQQVQQQLSVLRERIEELRSEEINLRQQIEKRKQAIEEEDNKFKSYIEKSKRLQQKRESVINETTETAEEQYKMFDSAQTAEENALRDQYDKQIEDLRMKISKMRNKASAMKESIETGRTPDSDLIDDAKIEKSRISQQLDKEVISKDESGESAMLKKIKAEYKDRKYLIGRMDAYKKQMKTLKEEKKGILMELKRIDFMVFGKNGKYQRIPKDL